MRKKELERNVSEFDLGFKEFVIKMIKDAGVWCLYVGLFIFVMVIIFEGIKFAEGVHL